jgi:hypothetical protein
MPQQMKFYFFQVAAMDDSPFWDALEQLDKTDAGNRYADLDGRHLCIPNLDRLSGTRAYAGDLLRIRMDDLPVRASLTRRNYREFDLDDDEGAGERSVFRYDDKHNILCLQSNFYIRAGTFAATISKITGVEIGLIPVLTKDSMERFAAMQTRKLEFSFRRPSDFNFLRKLSTEAHRHATLARDMGAASVSVTYSLGHESGDMGPAASLARKLLEWWGHSPDEVTRLRIEGRSDDDVTAKVDLIADRLVESVTTRQDDPRYLPWETRKQKVGLAWSQAKKHL